jgi:CRISPR-associated protein Cmr4
MFDAAEMIGIYAETPVHPGSGATKGAVDLPVQRESHTGIPLIPASSLKGVLRNKAEQKVGKTDPRIAEVFGPEKGDEYGGALAPTDARLLLFPVRSLEGIFAWVTCPMVIQRFARDLALKNQALAQTLDPLKGITVNDGKAHLPQVNGKNSPLSSPLVLV